MEFDRKYLEDFIARNGLSIYFCVSKDKDVLSQWRSYANDGQGVAIGFDVDFIEKHYSLYGAEVIYDKEKQYDILSQKISDSVLRNLNNAVKIETVMKYIVKAKF